MQHIAPCERCAKAPVCTRRFPNCSLSHCLPQIAGTTFCDGTICGPILSFLVTCHPTSQGDSDSSAAGCLLQRLLLAKGHGKRAGPTLALNLLVRGSSRAWFFQRFHFRLRRGQVVYCSMLVVASAIPWQLASLGVMSSLGMRLILWVAKSLSQRTRQLAWWSNAGCFQTQRTVVATELRM